MKLLHVITLTLSWFCTRRLFSNTGPGLPGSLECKCMYKKGGWVQRRIWTL